MKSMYEPIEWLEKARLDMYEETKHMTDDEWVEHTNTTALRILKEHGLTRSYEQLLQSIRESKETAAVRR